MTLRALLTVHSEERETSVRAVTGQRARAQRSERPACVRPRRLRPVLHAPGWSATTRPRAADDAVRLHAIRRIGGARPSDRPSDVRHHRRRRRRRVV